MTEPNDIYWAINNGYWNVKDKIDELIYQPTRYKHRIFYYSVLNYCYRHMILSPNKIILLSKNGTTLDTLDSIRLLTKKYNNPWMWCFNPPKIPITFEEFINNRSLSKYIQRASKEVTYGNANKNSNHN